MTRPDDARPDAAAEAAAEFGAILSHPRRVKIIGRLMRGRASAKTLSDAFDAPLENVAYHLRTLFKRFGVVEPVAQRRRRGATETLFRLRPTPSVRLLAFAVAAYEAEALDPSARSLLDPPTLVVDDRGARQIAAAVSAFSAVVATEKRRCEGLGSADLTQLVVSAAAIELAPLPHAEA